MAEDSQSKAIANKTCAAKTLNKKPCKNKKKSGSEYCTRHDKKYARKEVSGEVDLCSIGECTTKFSKKAEQYLNIIIVNKDNFEDIINHGVADKDKISFGQQDLSQ
ncbi:hypothetical protein CONCODRAFT_68470 [Conidiobolus coronatus NRRL 28638]|uniref:Uncharacterized protein n=1 Tax=Conidiobolus coronatus (strain ATCC 28846 / CBS 209.66 / NRRL 28638) TaxID=796925 RepID=A0A137PDX4_CONC2|nr:hypothetical protein CONCODRAFT_68470 [Conidiobolus coronatus NRRL 28638]|eukprot:KXN73213.1 hypothetical protein CONCODRAFT_68470 [Conidiobolus coronatus NRRL 28638]